MRGLSRLVFGFAALVLISACGDPSCSELQAEVADANERMMQALSSGDFDKARSISEEARELNGKTCVDEDGNKKRLGIQGGSLPFGNGGGSNPFGGLGN